MSAFLGEYVYGDTAKVLGWVVKDRSTGAILSLVGATNGTIYYRRANSATSGVSTLTPTMGGAAGSIIIYPGAQADLAPTAGNSIKYDVWAEFDLSGKHYVVPDDGPDNFKMRRDR